MQGRVKVVAKVIAAMAVLTAIGLLAFPSTWPIIEMRLSGVEIRQRGSFEFVALRTPVDSVDHPSLVGEAKNWNRQVDDVLLLYLRSKSVPIYSGPSGDPLASSHALTVTDSGAVAYARMFSPFADPRDCVVAIAGGYPPTTRSIDVQIRHGDRVDTVFSLSSIPPSYPNKAESRSVAASGIRIEGEAWYEAPSGSVSPGYILARVQALGADSALKWRWTKVTVERPYFAKGDVHLGFGGVTTNPEPILKSLGIATYVPYASELSKVPVSGSLDAFDIYQETVDFGEVPLTHRKGSQGERQTEVAPAQSRVRATASGLKLEILPYDPVDAKSVVYGGNALYYRIRFHGETLASSLRGKEQGDATMVQVRPMLGKDAQFVGVSSEAEPQDRPSFIHVVPYDASGAPTLRLKFEVQKLVLRRHIPFKLSVPVQRGNGPVGIESLRGLGVTGSTTFR